MENLLFLGVPILKHIRVQGLKGIYMSKYCKFVKFRDLFIFWTFAWKKFRENQMSPFSFDNVNIHRQYFRYESAIGVKANISCDE